MMLLVRKINYLIFKGGSLYYVKRWIFILCKKFDMSSFENNDSRFKHCCNYFCLTQCISFQSILKYKHFVFTLIKLFYKELALILMITVVTESISNIPKTK